MAGNTLSALSIVAPENNGMQAFQASQSNAINQRSARMQQEAQLMEQYAQLGLGVMGGNPDGEINQDYLTQALDVMGDSPLKAKLQENPELLRTITKGSLNVLAASRDAQRFEMEKQKFEADLAAAQAAPTPMEINNQLVDPTTREVLGDYRDRPKEPGPMEVNNQLVDPASGKVIGDYRDPVPTGPDPKEAFGNEKDLFQQYSNSDPVKTYETVKTSYERLKESAAQQSGAGDLGMIYGYMKMLDPGSVVRESEFAMAAQAGDLGEQIQGMVSRILNGERLPEAQRQEFLKNAEGLYRDSAANLTDINAQFEERAKGAGVDPTRFIRKPEEYKPVGGDDGEVIDWTELDWGD